MRCLVLPVVLLAACGDPRTPAPVSSSPAQPSDAATATTFADKLVAIQRRMHVRFGAAERIEQAIALGDIERANAEARTIVELDEPDVLPQWKPYLANVRAAATEIADARDPIAGARRTAELGSACARCHIAIGARISFPRDPAPPASHRLVPQMAGHQWAAQQMWRGVIAPSDERWLAGAHELADARLDIVAQAVTPWSVVDVDDIGRVRSMATTALAIEPSERASTFAGVLATCAHCHSILRDNEAPKAPALAQ